LHVPSTFSDLFWDLFSDFFFFLLLFTQHREQTESEVRKREGEWDQKGQWLKLRSPESADWIYYFCLTCVFFGVREVSLISFVKTCHTGLELWMITCWEKCTFHLFSPSKVCTSATRETAFHCFSSTEAGTTTVPWLDL